MASRALALQRRPGSQLVQSASSNPSLRASTTESRSEAGGKDVMAGLGSHWCDTDIRRLEAYLKQGMSKSDALARLRARLQSNKPRPARDPDEGRLAPTYALWRAHGNAQPFDIIVHAPSHTMCVFCVLC